jgi:subfamily B ATP-binding cassette protein MsbA
VHFFAAVALAIIIGVALRQAAEDQTTVGSFVSFITAMLMLLPALRRLTDVNAPIQRGLAAAESVFALIDEAAEEDTGSVELGRAQGHIDFDHVTFTYPGAERPALKDLSLSVRPGECVALVGASGSGKTTVANLLPRFYGVETGEIRVDGHRLSEVRLQSLRANIALVSQDVVLFNDTIAANIAYGSKRGASRDDIRAAAGAAHALEFIDVLAEGIDTMIGENGVKLSGGQRQRLAIARAILKDAPILILDEATSALDTESERHVQAALDELMRGRTTLVIAHRLSTIENADRIVVLHEGRLCESGRHAELLALNGAYARLHSLQVQAEKSAGN